MKSLIFLILLIPIHLYAQGNPSISGTYRFGKDINKENVGEILVVTKADKSAIIYITTSLKAPSYNTFSLLTEVRLIDNKAYYQPKTVSGKLGFVFSKNAVITIDSSAITSSHFSLNNIEFKKVSDKIPEYFLRGDGRTIALKETVDDFETNYYPNTSLWDYIGIWNFSQKNETLNVSKDITKGQLNIQYNSATDGFEDRFFDNCKFINGKIIGDYYGAKENVMLEIVDDKLLLTIDPFHEFQPIKKQIFKKSVKFIYKYNASNSNSYLTDKPTINAPKIDSVPPGDRVLINNQNVDGSFFKRKYHVRRFHKNLIEHEHLYVSKNSFRNTKPLLLKSVQLKGFASQNKSELFIQGLYSPEKLKNNMSTVPIIGAEQNFAGQQKLFVNEEVFIKLGLRTIGQEYAKNNLKVFITGTVDLCKDFLSLVVDYQYDDSFNTYLVNYGLKGEYIDHILIGRDDYVESMTPIKTLFTPGEIYTNSLLQIFEEEETEIGSGYYQTYETKRYVFNDKGQFIASNHLNSFVNEPELLYQVLTQKVKSENYGNALLSLYLNYIDTNQAGGYAISMHTKIETENGTEIIIPVDLSLVAGFYFPPYGDFIGPVGELQKLFYTNYHDGIMEGLNISFFLKDRNNDGLDDLNMTIEDTNYREWPKEELLFIHEGNEWVLTIN